MQLKSMEGITGFDSPGAMGEDGTIGKESSFQNGNVFLSPTAEDTDSRSEL